MRREVPSPTLDDYLCAMRDLAVLVRRAFEDRKSVSRRELLAALERYERLEWLASPEQH